MQRSHIYTVLRIYVGSLINKQLCNIFVTRLIVLCLGLLFQNLFQNVLHFFQIEQIEQQ